MHVLKINLLWSLLLQRDSFSGSMLPRVSLVEMINANKDKLIEMRKRRNSVDNEQWHHMDEVGSPKKSVAGTEKMLRRLSLHFEDEEDDASMQKSCMLHHNSRAYMRAYPMRWFSNVLLSSLSLLLLLLF